MSETTFSTALML